MLGLQTVCGIPGTMMAKRPFFQFWFMGQIARCLQLWSMDKSLTFAVELAKHFIPPINYLTALWPCVGKSLLVSMPVKYLFSCCYLGGSYYRHRYRGSVTNNLPFLHFNMLRTISMSLHYKHIEQRTQYIQIRKNLDVACREAGIVPPPPVDINFPLPSSLTSAALP